MKKTSHLLSYWEHDAFFKPYDLIIIGAGIVGLSAAYFTKKKNPQARIMIVEKGFLPSGASTKNAGFSCFGSPTELLDDYKKESADDIIKRIKWRWDGSQILRNTIGDETLQFNPCGGYELFKTSESYEESLEQLPLLNEWMYEATGHKEVFISRSFANKPAIFSRIEGSIHSGFMMKKWIELNQEIGNEIRFQTEVKSIQTGLVLLSNDIELETKSILVSTNGFAAKLLPIGIKPARGLVFVTKPLTNLTWKGTFHYDEGFVYFRNIGERLLLGGGRNIDFLGEETTEYGVNEAIKAYLHQLSTDLLGIPLQHQIEYAWSGIMGFSDTKMPVMTEIKSGIHIRAGLGGMGVAIGSEIGYDFAQNFS